MARTRVSERPPPKRKAKAPAPALRGGDSRQGLVMVSPRDLEPNPFQPRSRTDDENLKELAASIASSGVIEPLVVRPHGDGKYQIIAGERRWRASMLAKLKQLPAVVNDCSDNEMELLALQENLHREDLNDMDRSRALTGLKDKLGLTWDQLAGQMGLSRRRLLMLAKLQDLPDDLQEDVAAGKLQEKHARALGTLATIKEQRQLATAIQKQGLSGDQAIRVAQLLQQDPERDIKTAVAAVAEPERAERRSRASRAAAHCKEALASVKPEKLPEAERKRLAGELATLLQAVQRLVEQLSKEA